FRKQGRSVRFRTPVGKLLEFWRAGSSRSHAKNQRLGLAKQRVSTLEKPCFRPHDQRLLPLKKPRLTACHQWQNAAKLGVFAVPRFQYWHYQRQIINAHKLMEEHSAAGSVTITPEITEDFKSNVHSLADFGKKIEEYIAQSTTNLLDVILFGGILLQASDIHFEPQEEQIRLRIRIDGLLQDAYAFEKETYHLILSRLKLLSKIKLNITDKAQDGRFTIATEDNLIEIRTSSLPAEYGESIVMRILNPKNLKELDALGLRKDLYDIFLKEIKK